MNRFFKWPRTIRRGKTHILPATAACGSIVGAALAAALLLGSTAMAADFSSGNWYDTTSGCTAGSSGDEYIGDCKTSGDASDAEVKVTGGSGSGSDTADDVIGGYSEGGNVTDNSVTVSDVDDGNVARVYGGKSGLTDGRGTGNSVTISNAAVGNVFGGRVESGSADAEAMDNVVHVSGQSKIGGSVVGGSVQFGNVSGNEVVIDGETEADWAFGGTTIKGNAENNHVTIKGEAKVNKRVYGGRAGLDTASHTNLGTAAGNVVSIQEQGLVDDDVYGGRILTSATGYAGDATNNEVHIKNQGKVTGSVYGGRTIHGEATGNKVTLSDDAEVGDGIVGGFVENTGDATGNTVTLHGNAQIDKNVHGGQSNKGNAAQNTVVLEGGTVGSSVRGGFASDANANGNRVTITDGTVGYQAVGGYSEYADAIDNTVEINGGTMDDTIYGGFADQATASGNHVTMNGGHAKGDVIGGGGDKHADGNDVTIAGGTVDGDVYGGAYTGLVTDDASDNTVHITDGHVKGNIFGAKAGQNAENNTVLVEGGTIDGDVSAVYSVASGATTNNRVIVKGAPTINGGLYGYEFSGSGTHNVLEVHTKDLTVENVGKFRQYDFILPADIADGDVVLTLTDAGGTDLEDAQVAVGLKQGNNVLATGDRVTLIHNDNGVDSDTVTQQTLTGYSGIATEYQFGLDGDTDNLYAVLESVGINEQTKAPVEGRVAGLTLLTQGGELASGAGMAQAVAQAQAGGGGASFGVIQGGHFKYNSGSHVDVNGVNLVAGVSKRLARTDSALTTGGFIEGGWSSHKTYNRFDDRDVRGKGNARYIGVGGLIHDQWDNGLHAEGAVRIGHGHTDWHSNDLLMDGRSAVHAAYSTSGIYYGAHAGAGYLLTINELTALDLTAAYNWVHQSGDHATVAGDRFEFDSVDSHRTRLGAQLNRSFTEQMIGYVGTAWDHEFDGKAEARVHGLRTPSPSMKGNTGVLEVGVNMRPGSATGLHIDVGVQGYAGRRQGVAGTARLEWQF